MAVTLTYRTIRNNDFPKALRKIVECSEIKSVPVLLRIVKAFKVINEADKACVEVQQKLLDQHGIRQENGSYNIPNPVAYNAAYEELLKTEFEVEGDAFKFNDLLPAKLNAADLAALDNLVLL